MNSTKKTVMNTNFSPAVPDGLLAELPLSPNKDMTFNASEEFGLGYSQQGFLSVREEAVLKELESNAYFPRNVTSSVLLDSGLSSPDNGGKEIDSLLFMQYEKNMAISYSSYYSLIVLYSLLIAFGSAGNGLVLIAVVTNASELRSQIPELASLYTLFSV